MDENEYAKMLDESGIDVGQKTDETVEEKEETLKTPEPKEETQEEETQEEETQEEETPETLKTKEELKKRSIYDEYKEKKQELRTEKEMRESAEKERDELANKLATLTKANPEERKQAEDDVEEYAKSIGADPNAIQTLIELVEKKRIKHPEISEEITKDLKEFKDWKAQNSQVIEKQMFDSEFERTLPTIKDMFSNVNADELGTVKQELDKLAHTKEFHDKDLDYVVWKNKDHLSKFISPKKKGMETKGNHSVEEDTFEFSESPDFSKMSEEQISKWYETYQKASKETNRDVNGKLVL